MKVLSLLYFKLQLGVFLLGFLLDLIIVKMGKVRFMLLCLFFSVATATLAWFLLRPEYVHTSTPPLAATTPKNTTLFITKQLSQQEAEQELEYWLILLEKQPSHRDILINVSQLYRALGKENQAHYYWEQARKVDPNNPLFL